VPCASPCSPDTWGKEDDGFREGCRPWLAPHAPELIVSVRQMLDTPGSGDAENNYYLARVLGPEPVDRRTAGARVDRQLLVVVLHPQAGVFEDDDHVTGMSMSHSQ
jgi:hypothetical protein